MIRRKPAHLPDTKGFLVRDKDKAAILELLDEELRQHYNRDNAIGVYGAFDTGSHQFIKRALNFVLGSHYDESEFALKPADPKLRYDWVDQGRLAIIASFLLDNRDAFNLTLEMCENAQHLKHHVRDEFVPASILRPAA